jgi:predicted Zn-dependent protease
MSDELDLAGRVVELLRRVGGPGAEAEVTVARTGLELTRFANSYVHQNVADTTVRVTLRVHVDGRTATGSGSRVDDDGLRALVERTLAAARLCPPDPRWPGLAPPAAVATSEHWDEGTAGASPDDRARLVRDFVDAAGGLETAGFCRTARRSVAFANSAGQAVTGRGADAAMDGIARLAGADGVARLASARLADVDGALLGARAAAKARAGADPVELPPADYEVVLEPSAVADVLQNLAWYGFNGRALLERQSFAEPGVAQFDPAVTLVDDVPGTPAVPFDTEGTPRHRLVLVDGGTTRAVAHDRRTADQAGTEPTGHALVGTSFGPVPLSLTWQPPAGGPAPAEVAGPAADSEVARLVSGVRRGLLVTDFWYTRVLDPKSLVVTGLTRNGVWLVEDGEVTRPVRDLRFTQAYPAALVPGAVLGVGRSATMLPDRWDGAWWTAPAVRLAGWHFTGGASG